MKKTVLSFGVALAASAELKTAESFMIDDYVTNGLIMWYDGIASAGKNVPQDKTATTWQDLADDNHSATLTVADADKAGSWLSTGRRSPTRRRAMCSRRWRTVSGRIPNG